MIFPVSRGISRAADPAAEARRIRDEINAARAAKEEAVAASSTPSSSSSSSSSAASSASAAALLPHQVEFIEFSIARNVLRFGEFSLKSGRQSPYFFNAGLFATGAAVAALGKHYAATIMQFKADWAGSGGAGGAEQGVGDLSSKGGGGQLPIGAIFGPAYKGIPLATAVGAALSSHHGVDIGVAYNRKEKKDHGEGGVLVGHPLRGERVLIVDDVIVSSSSFSGSSSDVVTEQYYLFYSHVHHSMRIMSSSSSSSSLRFRFWLSSVGWP